MLKEHLIRQLHFEKWANRRVLESLEQVGDARALQLFGHILAAQETWLGRLKSNPVSPDVQMFPAETLPECRRRITELESALSEYIESVSEEALRESITYSRVTGQSHENTRLDILAHLFLHSQHHRGQIAARVRQHGGTPAVTDFIVYVREGHE